ncbi:hypothetical protein EX302_06300 [Staphylococcus epidermidis]|nr:hypothetical protein [Staphylococcus pseudintermedius]NAN48434.1 hypothetical protein [Staphylococcus epidermidis]OFL66016.1 hypothetical protein HMPREF2755_10775 [Staphylococcus sp. HMSC072H01]EGQ2977187.1 hypothetical protein [Staphylococcus pseudintermedius]NKD35002.1 hypothetical protein [Staphylococcus epidermidis]
MKFQVSPYFLITQNAEGLKKLYEELFGAKTLYIQRLDCFLCFLCIVVNTTILFFIQYISQFFYFIL